jgi:hypothetical protein
MHFHALAAAAAIPTMKHALRSYLHAWLMAVLLVPATLSHAADNAPAPDYQTLVKGLFEEADVVRITGHLVDGIYYDIDKITTKAMSLQKLKDMFLAEKPHYLGHEIPPLLGEHASSRLNFTWVNVEQKELGHAALLEGDRLLINGSLLFTLSTTPGEKNTRLLRQAAHYANPWTFSTPADAPNYRNLVSGFFARATACKITGFHIMRDRMIGYTTPDALSFQELKRIFLNEKLRYEGERDPNKELSSPNNLYKFTWVDARGNPLGRATLAGQDTLSLDGHMHFTTNSRGLSGSDATLWCGVTRLVDPGKLRLSYHEQIENLFAKATTCRIQGRYTPGTTLSYDVNFTASDAATLRQIKNMFLFEDPRDIGRSDDHDTSEKLPSRLHLTWQNPQGKELGRVALFNGDRLEFEDTHELYSTSTDLSEEPNTTLLTRTARLALPRIYGKPSLPDYQNLIQVLFATATTCRIKGYYTDLEADVTHDVDFTAADAPALQSLQQIFRAETPDYLGSSHRKKFGDSHPSNLHFFWADAQGKELGHVALFHGEKLLFESTHDLFTTSTGQPPYVDTTLLSKAAHLALPAIYGKPGPPAKSGGVKPER